MIRIISTIIMLPVFSLQLCGQDSLKTLSAQQVIGIVKRFHPVAKQADITIEKAKADLITSRGDFDPLLQNRSAQKTFDGTEYYYHNQTELTIPGWFGIEVRAGMEYLSGVRVNPEETQGRISYLGISVPIAKNLLMDKRRAALQTATILRNASVTEKRNTLNNLLHDALKSYWNWVYHYQVYQIISNVVTVNEKRIQFVKSVFQLGDRPAIDTTEALAQLYNYQLLQSQAWLDFQNASLDLSLFLWTAEAEPYYLPETVFPADNIQALDTARYTAPVLSSLLDEARRNHPELALYDYKLDALTVEKKLKFQELLPSVNFTYNQLGKGYNILKSAAGPLFDNNFQYGINMGIPLRLSAGRGEYRKAKLKLEEMKLYQSQKRWEVENKIRSSFNELINIKGQIVLQEKAYKNTLALQRAEETRFQAGESSLFFINTRENKTLEALQKLVELKIKYFQSEATLQWAAGKLML